MFSGALPQATNRQSWSEVIEVIDMETGEPDDISDVDEITFAVREAGGSSPILTLTLEDGITLIDDDEDSKFQIDVTVDQMRTLCRGTYEVGITMEVQGETVPLFAGTWPIIDGVLS